ncbi:MAG TPA: sigma-70 family RNA polymerase sigma factor [Verrucomicrobiae bacterium]|jgi:RNA polymerase sigma-70 factor (ECF subfamily)|nr:sigma-70 family RNA polymerase sigma factor [Verrucomicrobiae bacterium]
MADFENVPDEELARQSQAGSLVAFEELVRRFEHRIYAFVFQSCRNGADASDLTQETFVRAFQAMAQFDPRQAFAPWLFTIARRKCIDFFRARRPLPMPEEMDAHDPSDVLSEREESGSVWNLARRILPEAQYQAVWLHYAQDLKVREIAPILSKSPTHIKVMLLRARHALAAKLRAARSEHETAPSAIIAKGESV